MGGQNGSRETSEVAMMWLEDGRRRAGMWAGPGSDSLVSLDLQRPGLCPSHACGTSVWRGTGEVRVGRRWRPEASGRAGSVLSCGWRALPWAWPPRVPASAGPGLLLGPSAALCACLQSCAWTEHGVWVREGGGGRRGVPEGQVRPGMSTPV